MFSEFTLTPVFFSHSLCKVAINQEIKNVPHLDTLITFSVILLLFLVNDNVEFISGNSAQNEQYVGRTIVFD